MTSRRSSVLQPVTAVESRATAKQQEIPPASRAEHRVPSTTNKSATFTIYSPAETDVAIAGTFSDWQPQAMTKGQDGLWRITLQLIPGIYEYRFLVGAQWQDDPNNPRRTPNGYGGFNSICEVV